MHGHLSGHPFLHKKRHFLSRIDDYHRFFGLFLTSDEPGLSRTGLNLDLGEGVSLHVIESTSFSSPTGLPEPQSSPPDPPDSLPRSFGKLYFFQTLLGGLSGGLGGLSGGLGGQLGLKSSSIRGHGVFPRRPKSTSNPFFPRSKDVLPCVGSVFLKIGPILDAGCGRSVIDPLSL